MSVLQRFRELCAPDKWADDGGAKILRLHVGGYNIQLRIVPCGPHQWVWTVQLSDVARPHEIRTYPVNAESTEHCMAGIPEQLAQVDIKAWYCEATAVRERRLRARQEEKRDEDPMDTDDNSNPNATLRGSVERQINNEQQHRIPLSLLPGAEEAKITEQQKFLKQWRRHYYATLPNQEWPTGLDIDESFFKERVSVQFELAFYAHVKQHHLKHVLGNVFAPYYDKNTYLLLGTMPECMAALRDVYGMKYKKMWRANASYAQAQFSKELRRPFQKEFPDYEPNDCLVSFNDYVLNIETFEYLEHDIYSTIQNRAYAGMYFNESMPRAEIDDIGELYWTEPILYKLMEVLERMVPALHKIMSDQCVHLAGLDRVLNMAHRLALMGQTRLRTVRNDPYKQIIIITGKAGTGKSVVSELMESWVIPSQVTTINAQFIDGHTSSSFVDKKLVFIDEITKVKNSGLEILLPLGPGARVAINPKHEEPRSEVMTANLVISGNQPPDFKGSGDNFLRRSVHFAHKHEIIRKNKHINVEMAKSSGHALIACLFFTWALRNTLKRDGINDIRDTFTGSFKADCDGLLLHAATKTILDEFVTDMLTLEANAEMPEKALNTEYQAFLARQNEEIVRLTPKDMLYLQKFYCIGPKPGLRYQKIRWPPGCRTRMSCKVLRGCTLKR